MLLNNFLDDTSENGKYYRLCMTYKLQGSYDIYHARCVKHINYMLCMIYTIQSIYDIYTDVSYGLYTARFV